MTILGNTGERGGGVIEHSGKFSLGFAWLISKWRCIQGSCRGWCETQRFLMSSASVSPRGKIKSSFEKLKNDTNFEYEAFRKTDDTMRLAMKLF